MQRSCTLLFLGLGLLCASLFAQQTPAASTSTQSKSTTATHKSSTTHKAASTAAPVPLNTAKEKFSYALGMNLGENLHRQEVEIDPAIFMRALKDALAGRKLQMTDEEGRAAVGEVQNQLRAKQAEKMQQEDAANKKQGADFLAENKAKPGVVTLPSGLQYKIVKEGTGPKPLLPIQSSAITKGRFWTAKSLTAPISAANPLSSR